jgi:selenobiotic family peptide radical SAM maturase
MRVQTDRDNNKAGYLPELARLKDAYDAVSGEEGLLPSEVEELTVNPTVRLIELAWKNLVPRLGSEAGEEMPEPEEGLELALLWLDPRSREVVARIPSEDELMALKIVFEGIPVEDAAREGGTGVGVIESAIDRAARKGILIKPPSRIRRIPLNEHFAERKFEQYLSTKVFVLQWHITQACDLHCKHCYDRNDYDPMSLEQGIKVLDDLRDFCRQKNVRGQVSFSGGNPLLYPHFFELYRAAAERGFRTAILGNPAPRQMLQKIMDIQEPEFFQVSLEGLRAHNDTVRGEGHFDRTIKFLGLLKDMDIYSMVMLTLTRENMDQVLPLANLLIGKTDAFNFNRLSMVGEGASLGLPPRGEFSEFLKDYLVAAKQSPIMGLKDNLLNIIRHNNGIKPFGGCTGYGCGAAFNFISLLSDGEAHACRKFPSPIGNVFEQGISAVYDSEAAARYRTGPKECAGCSIRPVCGGCLAVAHSHGLDVFKDRDPYCFIDG